MMATGAIFTFFPITIVPVRSFTTITASVSVSTVSRFKLSHEFSGFLSYSGGSVTVTKRRVFGVSDVAESLVEGLSDARGRGEIGSLQLQMQMAP